jgi:hypothetical protein
MKNFLSIIFLVSGLNSCTHYKSISFEALESKNLIGRWEMSLPPYHITIDCDASVSFIKPSKYLYGDQNGSKFLITDLEVDTIVTGPVIRYDFQVEEWPHDQEGEWRMTVDGRMWHRTKKFNCESNN